MYDVEVNPIINQSTHHVSLTDGEKTVGLIICDSKGAADPFNLTAAPNARSSLRTKTGTTKYEDLDEPWSATAQDDWSGGRALEDYEEDTTRFFDSKRCQTAFTQIYNAPLDYYAEGLKDSKTNWPGSVQWRMIQAGSSYGMQINLTEAMSAGELYILLRRRGTPTAGLTVRLCANEAGAPGTVLAEHSYTVTEISDVISEWRKFSFEDLTLAAGYYWITIGSSVGDYESNSWQIGTKRNSESTTYINTGSGWVSVYTYDIYYRLCAADSGRTSRFFIYKQLTFALTQLPSGDPKLYINGDLGMADSNSEALGTLIDGTKSWTTDQWKGCRVGIIAGAGVAETESVWRTIVSNDATSLTVDQPWTIPHDETTTYVITDTNRFYEIDAAVHGLTGYVWDIAVVNDIVYFAQGDEIPIRKLKWRGGSWTSMADAYEHGFWENGARVTKTVNNCAMYLQTVRDTSGLVMYRANNNDGNHQISISQTAVTDWIETPVTVANRTTSTGSDLVFTDGVDMGKPDDVAMMYKITAGTIGGSAHPVFRVTLQGSEDNVIFEDVKYVDLDTSGEEQYMAATSFKRYRRFKIQAIAGTSPTLSSLNVVTADHSKFIGTYTFNDSYGKITRLAEYPMMMNSQYMTLWINREGMVHSVSSDGTVDTINLEELQTVMEEWNGRSSIVHNAYYYFRWMTGSIQRYYNLQLDSVGPDRDAGLPEERQGQISDMLSYPGRYFAAVDAGDEGTSCVLLNNNSGWHEIYRAPNPGERIRALGYQAISGKRPDRLWISVGDDIVWLVMPSNTLKAYYDDQAEYTHESVMVSSWMSIGMIDVIKQWGSMNVMAENLEDEAVYIEADYQIDRDPTWYPMSGHYVISPDQEIKFKDTFGVSAKRLRYRLRLQTNDKSKTPFVKAVVMKTVIKIGTKYCFSFPCRNLLNDVNLRGEVEDITPWQRLQILMDWANNATALRMRAFTDPFDGKTVFLDPPQLSNLQEKESPGSLIQITLNEV